MSELIGKVPQFDYVDARTQQHPHVFERPYHLFLLPDDMQRQYAAGHDPFPRQYDPDDHANTRRGSDTRQLRYIDRCGSDWGNR